jgi:hypothetical protein
MRSKNLIVLTAGLALAVSILAPTAAQAQAADQNHGCGEMQNIGTEYYGADDGAGGFYFNIFGDDPNETFCNYGIAINGQFEIYSEYSAGCLAVDTTSGLITVDTEQGCDTYNGEGYQFDRWTAFGIKYHNNQLWMLRNVEYPLICIKAATPNGYGIAEPYLAGCDSGNHYEWFSWNVGL